jgi:UDP-glucose 4-epimerase
VEALFVDGHEVTGVDVAKRPNDQPGEFIHENLRVLCPVWDADFDAVVHLAAFGGVARAAREPRFIFEQNIQSTAALVDFLKGMPMLRRVILASSFSVYGSHSHLATELSTVDPLETYAASKLGQELAFIGSGLPVTTLRFSSVYGRYMRFADDEATILAKIVGHVMREETLVINEDGHQQRDFVYVGDIVDAIRAQLALPAGLLPDHERLVNICTAQGTSLRSAIQAVGLVLGKKPRVEYTGIARPGDMRDCIGGSTARMTALLGRVPTSFPRGAIEAFAGLETEKERRP